MITPTLSLDSLEKDEQGAYIFDQCRYIYTKEKGWIDMKHFFASAKSGESSMTDAQALGLAIELKQKKEGDDSAFSYEDLPSNKVGAEFGYCYLNRSGYSFWGSIKVLLGYKVERVKLSQQIKGYFEKLKPLDPKKAPNWSSLPNTGDEEDGYPKNYFNEPYNFNIKR